MPFGLNHPPDAPLVDETRRITRPWLMAFLQGGAWTFIVDLVTDVTGILGVTHGGTGKSSLTVHGVVIGNAASPLNVTSAGTSGQVLTSNGATLDPTFQANSAAPANAHYVTTQAESGLSAEFSLGSLTSGLLKQTVSAAVSTPAIAAAGTDYTDAAFKTISVSGQSDVVADSAADTLTLASGSGVTITTNAGTDTVTIAATGSGGTVTATGTLTSGKLIQGNGGSDITVNATTATVTKLTSGTPSAASAGTDYVAPGSITSDGITINTARLAGRTTASSGAVEEITVGSGLTLSAGSLIASGGGAGGALTLISSQTLGAAAASVTFSSIPGTYSHLRLIAYGRTTTSDVSDGVLLQFNGDTGTNYSYKNYRTTGAGTTVTVTGATTSASSILWAIWRSSSTGTAIMASATELIIPGYASTIFSKYVIATSVANLSTTGVETFSGMGEWLPATPVAITDLTLFPDPSGTGTIKFDTGCIFSLYGMQ